MAIGGRSRGPSFEGVALPRVLVPAGPLRTPQQRGALARLASSILADDGRYPALRDILARTPPRIRCRAPGERFQTIDIYEQRGLVKQLDGSYLFVQGPPGTGKTGARLVTELIAARPASRRGGHQPQGPIHNLLDEVEKIAREEGLRFDGLKKASPDNDESSYETDMITSATDVAAFASAGPEVLLFAGTAWLSPTAMSRAPSTRS